MKFSLPLLFFLFSCTSQTAVVQPTPTTVIQPTPQVKTHIQPSIETIRSTPTPTSAITPTPAQVITVYPTNTPVLPNTSTPTRVQTKDTPKPSITPTPQRKKEKRIVFVAGLCSTNSKDDFNQLESWIIKNMGHNQSSFDHYNYTPNGKSGGDYNPGETLKSVDDVTDGRIQSVYLKGSSAENFKNFLMKLKSKHKDAEFYVIAHSLGGVVALYSLDTYPELRKIIRGVLTVNSPLRGEGLLKLNTGRVFTCVKDYEEVEKLIPIPVFVDLKRDSQVIRDIDTDYSTSGVRVVTLANSNDPFLVSDRYSSGVLGTLNGAMAYIYSFAVGPPSSNVIERYRELTNIGKQHVMPLKILDLENDGKKDASEFVGRALRCMSVGDNCAYKK